MLHLESYTFFFEILESYILSTKTKRHVWLVREASLWNEIFKDYNKERMEFSLNRNKVSWERICLTKFQMFKCSYQFLTSLVVVFFKQRCAWYAQKPPRSNASIAKNTLRSICVLCTASNHCKIDQSKKKRFSRAVKKKIGFNVFLYCTCATCGNNPENEFSIP